MTKITRLSDHREYSDATITDLKRSGLYAAEARHMKLVELPSQDVFELTKGQYRGTGYQIPYFDRHGKSTDYFRIRFHEPQRNLKKPKSAKKLRYWQPSKGLQVYFAPCVDWEAIYKNTDEVGYLTEGEKKGYKACKEGLHTVGLGGVDSFASKPAGIELHPDVRDFVYDRSIGIVYDGETRTNPNVERAANRLADLILKAKAFEVAHIELPTGYNLDDYLKTHTAEEFRKLPYELHGLRRQLEALRANKKALGVRKQLELMRDLLIKDMEAQGSFHYHSQGTTKTLFWFDNRTRRLYPLDERNTRATVARMAQLYGMSGAEPEWTWLHDALANHSTNNGQQSAIHSLVYGKGGVLYIFNGESIFKVKPTGYKIVPNGTDGVLFHNPLMQRVELEDRREDTDVDPVDLLVRTPRFTATEYVRLKHVRLMFELWMWSPLFPQYMPTKAFPLIFGAQGSRKSSGSLRYIQTIYGLRAQVSYFNPKKLDGLITLLASQHIVPLDNVDGKHEDEIANIIAIATTGGEYTLRELYTTLSRRSVTLDTFLMVNSRDPDMFRRRSDITERMLPLPVEPSTEYKSENSIRRETRLNRGAWWLNALDLLPKMLAALRDYEALKHRYRMADFADFCFAIGPVLGYEIADIKEALDGMERQRASFATETSRLPAALAALLEKYTFVKNQTARALLKMLQELVPDFPYKNPISLGIALQNQAKSLRFLGISVRVKTDLHKKTKTYSISDAEPEFAGSAGADHAN